MSGYDVIQYVMDTENRLSKLAQELQYVKAELARVQYNQGGRIKFNPVRAGAGRKDIPVQYEPLDQDVEVGRIQVQMAQTSNPDLSEDLAALHKNLVPRVDD